MNMLLTFGLLGYVLELLMIHYTIKQFYWRTNSVGEIITDSLTDETRPSVTPIFVANSVANKKNHPPTEHQRTYRWIRAPKKKISRGKISDEINPSEFSTVITNGWFVGNYGIGDNCVATLCEIPTEIIRR